MRLSIVIPTCHRNDLLALCLDRLAPGRQKEAALGTFDDTSGADSSEGVFYEVIVSDDGREGTAEPMIRSRYPWAHWKAGKKLGPAANRNSGARHARGDWIVFLDDDCLPSDQLLHAYSKAISSRTSDVDVFEGRIEATGTRTHPFEECPSNESGGVLWSCNFCISRNAFRRIGGFDERFPFAAMEDMDLCLRLKAANHRIQFASEALVHHPWKLVNQWRHRRQHLKSLMIFLKIHPEQAASVSIRLHFRGIARFYLRDIFRGFREFGWLQLKCLPTIIWNQLFTAWVFIRRPEPESFRIPR